MSESTIEKNKYKEKFLQSSDILKSLKDKKVVLAYSGGPDSTFLLHMFLENGFNVELAYVNHMLRGEDSNKELEFVKNIASKHNIKVQYIERDILSISKEKKKGIEESAREVRYDFFESIPGIVATAHNLDDNVETFIFRMVRGTSLKGLCGIKRVRDKYIRPILHFSKREILEYLISEKIEYVKDYSNKSTEYTRNMIRLKIVPLMEEINPKFKEKILNLIEDIEEIDFDVKENSVSELKKLNTFDKRKALASLMKDNEVSRQKIELAEKLLDKEGSSSLDISKGIVLKKVYDKIYVDKKRDIVKIEQKILIGDTIEFFDSKISVKEISKEEYVEKANLKDKNTFFIDKNLLNKELIVRNRREGDYFHPLGSKVKKKLKKFFIDEKVDKFKRDLIPIFTIKDEIVWIARMRGSEKFKINDDVKEIIEIKVTKI